MGDMVRPYAEGNLSVYAFFDERDDHLTLRVKELDFQREREKKVCTDIRNYSG